MGHCVISRVLTGVIVVLTGLGCGSAFESADHVGAGGAGAATSGSAGGAATGGDDASGGGSTGKGGASGGVGGMSAAGGEGAGGGGACGPGRSEVGDTCYTFFTTEVTWPGAIAGCASDGGYLAVLRTLEELDALLSSGLIPPIGPIGPWGITWVGGIDYGGGNVFSWHNMEPWIFPNHAVPPWKHTQEPNDLGSNESCTDIYVYEGAGGVGLNDEACDSPRPYLCEYEPL